MAKFCGFQKGFLIEIVGIGGVRREVTAETVDGLSVL